MKTLNQMRTNQREGPDPIPWMENIQKCPHLQISTNRSSNEKPSCLNCGLVQEPEDNPYVYKYIRNITHYKELYKSGIIIPTTQILGETIKNQVIKFKLKKNEPKKRTFNPSDKVFSVDKMNPQMDPLVEVYRNLYLEYIEFLRNNEDRILPKKNRKRQICQIYGNHRKILLEYIFRLCPSVGSFGSPK